MQAVRLRLASVPHGPLVMAFNDHGQGGAVPHLSRTFLSLALSHDDGGSWRRVGVLRAAQVSAGVQIQFPVFWVERQESSPHTAMQKLRILIRVWHGATENP